MTTKKADVVISCGGGELMCEVLDYVNFIKNPGIFNIIPPYYGIYIIKIVKKQFCAV